MSDAAEKKPKFDPAQYLKKPDEAEKGFDPEAYAKPSEVFNARGPGTLFKVLDMPVKAVEAGIGAARDSTGPLDAISKAVPAALDQISLTAKPAPTFENIITDDMTRRGIPAQYAVKSGDVLGPAARVIADPLNFTPGLVGEGSKAIRTVGEAADIAKLGKLVPEEAFVEAPAAAGKKGSFGSRLITTLFGPGEDAVEVYKRDPEIINRAVGVVGIKDKLDKTVKRVGSVIGEKKANVEKLKLDAEDAFQIKLGELKTARPPTELRQDVTHAISDLQEEVSAKSAEAFQILDEAGITVPTPRLKGALQMEINQFESVGKITPEGRAAVARLQQIRDNLDDLPPELTGSQAKAIIQELDAVRAQGQRTGAYLDQEERIKQIFRGTVDGYLKENEKYKALMKGLSDDTRLLKEASKQFGDERRLESKLRNLHGDGAAMDRKLLSDLGHRTGRGQEFGMEVQEFLGAQRLLKNKDMLNQLKESLPEAQAYKAALEDLGLAEETIQRVQQKLGVDSTQNVVKQLIRGSDIESGRAVAELEKLTGEDFTDLVMAERIKLAFEGGKTNGARAATMGGDIGEGLVASAAQAFGKEVGGKFGPVGRMAGSVIGGYTDKYGGQMARKMIDRDMAAKVSKLKIFDNLKLPSPKTDGGGIVHSLMFHAPSLSKELLRPDSEINTTGEMVIADPAMLDEVSKAISADRETDSVTKAKILSGIGQRGYLELRMDIPPPVRAAPPAPPRPPGTLDDLVKSLAPFGAAAEPQLAE